MSETGSIARSIYTLNPSISYRDLFCTASRMGSMRRENEKGYDHSPTQMQHAKLQSKFKDNHHTSNRQSLLSSTRVLRTRNLSRLIQGPLFSPDLLNAPSVVARIVAVVLGPIGPFHGKTFVHFALDIIAVAEGFVDESACVTFVEGCHDLLAVYIATRLAQIVDRMRSASCGTVNRAWI